MSDTAFETDFDSYEDNAVESILGLRKKHPGITSFSSKNTKTKKSSNTTKLLNDNDIRSLTDQSAASTGLTFEQRRASMLIATFNYTDKQVAAEVGRSVATIQKWKRMPAFKKSLVAQLSRIGESAIQRRMQINNDLVNEIHKAILLSVHRGDLNKLSIDRQIKLLTDLSRESRLDDPAAATERHRSVDEVNHKVELVAIQERFNVIENRKRLRLAAAGKNVIDAEYTEEKPVHATITERG
jgi:transposase